MKTKVTRKKVSKPRQSKPAKVLVLRTCDANLRSRQGSFQWAEVGGITTAPDWSSVKKCGNGLHGWLWGSGDWSLKEKGANITWLVVEVDASTLVDLGGKVKFPSSKTVAVEKTWSAAMAFIRGYATYKANAKTATGNSGHAAATGNSGHAAATGDYGHAAATGSFGHAAATGDYGHAAATGDYGHAAATGNSGHAAATGNYGWAIAGKAGRAKAGVNGCLTITYKEAGRIRVAVGYVGEDGIKADTWYRVQDGKLVEVVA